MATTAAATTTTRKVAVNTQLKGGGLKGGGFLPTLINPFDLNRSSLEPPKTTDPYDGYFSVATAEKKSRDGHDSGRAARARKSGWFVEIVVIFFMSKILIWASLDAVGQVALQVALISQDNASRGRDRVAIAKASCTAIKNIGRCLDLLCLFFFLSKEVPQMSVALLIK